MIHSKEASMSKRYGEARPMIEWALIRRGMPAGYIHSLTDDELAVILGSLYRKLMKERNV